MRYLVLSDIHANVEALDAVAADTPPSTVDRVLVLGDLVGYGPDPNAVTDWVRTLPSATVIRGNHDKVATGLETAEHFNHFAKRAVHWTTETLTRENRDYLRALPMGPLAVDNVVEICHGTPFDEDVYIVDEVDALQAAGAASRALCLFGHTHVAAAFHVVNGRLSAVGPRDGALRVRFGDDGRWLVNCGAVGQPRDGDWRAAFGIVDTDTRTLALRRVEYDVAATQAKILAAGLPEMLAQRLGGGR